MSGWPDSRLRLAEYLTGVRAELSRARAEADRDDLKFDMDAATLEVDIAYSLARAEQPEFWVLARAEQAAGGEIEAATRARQRLTIRLTPRPEAVSGDETPVSGPTTLPWPLSTTGQ